MKSLASDAIAALFGLLAVSGTAKSQNQAPGHTNFTNWWQIQTFPDAQHENMTKLFAKADKLVKNDLQFDYAYRCYWITADYPDVANTLAGQGGGFIKPTKVFDNLYFVGQAAVSAWVVDTGDGIIILDSLYNGDEIEKVLIPGIQAFGFSMSDVKGLIITHEHLDHYGGAGYVQEKYKVPIYASDLAWEALEKVQGTPRRDKTLKDGEDLNIGNFSISSYLTPGHTPGCMSFMFSVTDNGEAHFAGLYGGGGLPRNASDKVAQMKSLARFAKLVEERHADVLLANHIPNDRTLFNIPILDNRACYTRDSKTSPSGPKKPTGLLNPPGPSTQNSGCTVPNPYIVGTDFHARYLKVQSVCVEIAAARNGQNLYD